MTSPEQNRVKEKSETAKRTGEKFEQVQLDNYRDSAHFFERFILLSAGTLVLSVSFLGYLSKPAHPTLILVPMLYASWGSLLLSLVGGIYRNYFSMHHFGYTYFGHWAESVKELKRAEIEALRAPGALLVDEKHNRIDLEDFAKNLEQKEKSWAESETRTRRLALQFEKRFRFCEFACQFGFIMGLLLLLFFAVLNVP